ncbi:ESX secretion-associated protein EspG [Actinosynnema sp. NPDC059335]|uniref:ESX secretion-associated protein EspG n=1 Tax=Actinosynnema sp. NPDC059335 TaxID=3346804 RepID=UPI00366D335D
MLRGPVVLSDTAFDVLWHHDDLGEHHTVLHVPPAEADVLEVERELHREGVRVDDTLEALRVLAYADSECFGWIAFNREVTLPVVVATAGRHGVFAVRDNGHVRIDVLRGDPSETLAACLPDVPAGRGVSINARAEEARGSRALAALVQRPRTGVAKLYAARRDRYGRRRRAGSFVTTLDCPDGRWLVVRYTDNRGQGWVHATPATRSVVGEWLRRLGD